MSLFSSALVAGKRHIDYTNKLGMPLEKIFTGFDVVDNNYFSQSAHSVRENEVEARHVLGISRKFFLVPCRFIPEKNLAMLAVAYEKYRRDLSSSGWDLVLVGDGPDRADIVALCRKVSISQYVHFVGFKQYNELPIFFGLASALILPSLKDTWGLVVNEAMASGLPVLVSSHCGCAPDLVSEGINGFTFDPTNSDALASLMHRLTVEGVDLKVMGDAGREIISEWGLERFSSGLWNAAVTACCSNRRRSNTFGRFLVRGAVIL